MAKTLWHTSLKEMGPTTVTVKHERQKSKFSKPGQPKPDYVILTINGEDFGYNVENEACANFFTGKRGQTFAIQAEGSRDDAKIVFVGAPASQMQPPPAQPAQRYDSNPPGRPGGGPDVRSPESSQAAAALVPFMGVEVGFAVGNSILTMNAMGKDWLVADGKKELNRRASFLLRLCARLRDGHLAPADPADMK